MNNSQTYRDSARIKRMVALLNMVPNVFWSCVNVLPVFFFCYYNMPLSTVYVFSAVSLLTLLLPRAFLNSIQLSRSTDVYKKIGVKYLNKFTQNGELINGIIRKKFPGYAVISNRNLSHKKLIEQTYMFEKFHFAMFMFFILTTIFALIHHYFGWAIVLCITNIAYNVYPNFLQQYIRIRIRSLPVNRKVPGR